MRHELTSLRLEPRPLGWEAVCDCGWSDRYRSRLRVLRRWHEHLVEETVTAAARRPALGPDGGEG